MDWASMALLAICGCSWGLTGYPDFRLVAFLSGRRSRKARVLYAGAGLLAVLVWNAARKKRKDPCS
ncbi:MAG TPA: DUF378 domain-containing protein [Firmicutes bacterium]|nr:DUF378 domain-containing protein [Bacillota bacterium]